jgi:hypothetical protein
LTFAIPLGFCCFEPVVHFESAVSAKRIVDFPLRVTPSLAAG